MLLEAHLKQYLNESLHRVKRVLNDPTKTSFVKS